MIAIIVLICSLMGFGMSISKIFRLQFVNDERPFIWFWIGFSIVILCLQIIQFFVPLTIYTSLFLFGVGILLFLYYSFPKILNLQISKVQYIYFGILSLIVVYICYLALFPPILWDGNLYHFATIRWQNEYAIVPGLGNLHGRFAFNQSYFLFVSALNFFPVFKYGHYLANSLLLTVLIADCLLQIRNVIKARKESVINIQKLLPVLFIIPIFYMMQRFNLSSASPDIALTILQIVLFQYFVRELFNNQNTIQSDSRTFFLILFSVLLITIKLSSWAFSGSVIMILLVRKVFSFIRQKKSLGKLLGKLLILPGVLLLIWCIRGIILSGCVAYPISVGCFDVSWAIPTEDIILMRNLILA
ncbi:MAG: hypothetical protein JEZ00_22145 [Anaerolineaceae bacterium]|nr:hypothetical protein [Anaerolineaceae bacterium]